MGCPDFLILPGILEKAIPEDLSSIFSDLQKAGATASALFVCPSGILFLRHTSICPSKHEPSTSSDPIHEVDEFVKPDRKPDEYATPVRELLWSRQFRNQGAGCLAGLVW